MRLIAIATLILLAITCGCSSRSTLPSDAVIERHFRDHRDSFDAIIEASLRSDPLEMARHLNSAGYPTARMGIISGPHRYLILLSEDGLGGFKGVASFESPPPPEFIRQNLNGAPNDETIYYRKLDSTWYIAQRKR